MTRLLGLYREAEYSPGRHRSNDGLLLEDIAETLRAHGLVVELTTIDRAASDRSYETASLVFSMCQGRAALDLLARWREQGVQIVNSPEASFNTYRERLLTLMQRSGVRFPSTRFVATGGLEPAAVDVNGGVWLKRGDVHAAVAADVQWIDSSERLRTALTEFASRGIAHAAVQHHQPGDEIKFYGVAGSRFFYWLYAASAAAAPATTFDVPALQRLAEHAAAAAGLHIFGGDAIVSPSGELTLIDLNDWPSFAPCRATASTAIADYLLSAVAAGDSAGVTH